MKQVKARRQLTVLVLVLSTLGISAVLYKHFSLGFPLLTSETQEVWQVESRISFTALGGPTTVKLNMPDSAETLRPIFSRSLAPEFDFSIDSEDGRHVAQWQREDAPPGETQVMSISLYDKVENLQYSEAHWLAGGLVIFSLVLLGFIYSLKRGDTKSE